MHEWPRVIRVFVPNSWMATDPERAVAELDESNNVAVAR
jgi:hypothetical protein